MRILQVGPIPPEVGGSTHGGVASHVWALSRQLAVQGHEMAILADNMITSDSPPIEKSGVTIYARGRDLLYRDLGKLMSIDSIVGILRLKALFADLIGLRAIVANLLFYKYVISDFEPEVIHVHHLEHRFPFAYFASDGRAAIVTTVHSFSSIKSANNRVVIKYRRLLERNFKLAHHIILVSNNLARFMADNFNFRGRSWVVHNPIEIPPGLNCGEEQVGRRGEASYSRILFVGKLDCNKGIFILLDAFKRLIEERKEYELVVVGSGPETEAVRKYVAEHQLDKLVKMEGYKPWSDLGLYYYSADLFVMPSFSEGFSLAYAEALSCGTPVVGCRGVADEVIQSSEYGLLVPPGDPIALEEAIEEGLHKKWNRAKISAFGKSFAWETNVHKFQEVYSEVLSHD